MRRFLAVTAGLAIVLLLIGLAGGGWYYTDQLLPAPVADDPTYDVEVLACAGCSVDSTEAAVTLAASDGDLVDLARVGFWTADSTLVLGEVVAEDATSVTRSAELTDGVWPEEGELGAASVTTFRGDPGRALDLAFRDVAVAGPTGQLPAWYVPGDEQAAAGVREGTVAVLIHGRGATREEMHRSLRTVHAAGVDAFVISIRNDPGAPSDPDGWGRFGDLEWEDLQAAVDHLVEVEGAEHLVLVGASQGGSIVLSWLRRGEHTERAVGAFLDSPLVSMHDTLVLQAENRGIPGVTIPPLLWSTKILATVRSGLRFDRLEHAADEHAGIYEVPMLVAHGDGDTTVPFSGSVDLADERPDLVELEVYAGVEHVRAWNADPDRYDQDLADHLGSLT